MKKNNSITMTSKLLAGFSIVAGLGTLPAYAVDVNKTSVDVNVKEVNASVYEKDGHYYAKLVADKEVSNVNVRIVAENKAEFTIKRDLIKAGEVVEVELDFNAAVAKKRLPNTAVYKTKNFSTTSQAGTHTFKITGNYDVLENESAATKVETINGQAGPTLKDLLDQNGGSQDATSEPKAEEPKPTTPAVETPKEEQPGKVDKDETPTVSLNDILNSDKEETTAPKTETTPAATPVAPKVDAPVVKPVVANVTDSTKVTTVKTNTETAQPTTVANNNTSSNAGVSLLKAPATAPKAPAQPATKTLPKAETPAQPTVSTATTREEAIQQAYIRQLNEFRVANGLNALSVNSQLNTATKNRANTVAATGVNANVHGPNGSYEKNAAKAAGYNKGILYNVVTVGNYGTPDQVASRMLDELYSERHNVVSAYPYGHRFTLLSKTATEVGAGVTISNGMVSLVQHQDHTGAFDGKTEIKAIAPKVY